MWFELGGAFPLVFKIGIMEYYKIKMYFDAAFKIFGSKGRAEAFLDDHSDKLKGNISSVKDAKKEIYKVIESKTI